MAYWCEKFTELFAQPLHIGHSLSFYRWLPLPDNVSSTHVESHLLNKGIHVFHSDLFLSGASTQDNYLRIALSSTLSLEELKRGLEIWKENLQF